MRHALSVTYDQMAERGDIAPDPAQRDVLEALEDLRCSLEARKPVRWWGRLLKGDVPQPRGIYIWGAVGRGKSMLMDLFYDHTAISAKRRVHFHAFMQDIHARLRVEREAARSDPLAKVARDVADGLELLCFDEMQITDIADAMLVGRLFEGLMDRGVVIVTTSNRPPRDLYKDGLNRDLFMPFIGLLQERMDILCLDARQDFRQGRQVERQAYFHPLGAGASSGIDAVWSELAGERPQPRVLTSGGRRIELPAASGSAARATFGDLCGQPLGPADFLLLAETFHALVLSDVPVMDRSMNNEAKRFITLIDSLYEAKRCLFISADAPPEDLYTEGPNAFEFARTASRLREMQSQDWLAACGMPAKG